MRKETTKQVEIIDVLNIQVIGSYPGSRGSAEEPAEPPEIELQASDIEIEPDITLKVGDKIEVNYTSEFEGCEYKINDVVTIDNIKEDEDYMLLEIDLYFTAFGITPCQSMRGAI